MELFIYKRELELEGVIDTFDSLRWRRRYFQPGEFELHCKATKDNILLLLSENIVARRDAKEAGVIENIELINDELVVGGRFLSSYLERRIIWNITTIRDTAEKAMRQLVSDNCINSRPIPRLILGELKGYTEIVDMQAAYKNLLDKLTQIAKVSNLGYIVRPDFQNKQLVFEVHKGLDRSKDQSLNPRAIFSNEFENVINSKYYLACQNYKNVCLVGGQGEGTARTLVTVGSGDGLDRYETFIQATDFQKDETMSDSEYLALLLQKGNEVLSSSVISESFESDVNLNSNLIYKQDFDLGDVVTCVNKEWGKVINVRITEIEEVYENGIMSITPTFGSPLPELIDILKEE